MDNPLVLAFDTTYSKETRELEYALYILYKSCKRLQRSLPTCAVTRRRCPVGARPTRRSLQPEATGAGMEVTKCLKPPDSGHEFGDRASVQAATRVNAEQTSHDEDLVKGSHHAAIESSPVASVSKVQAHLRDAA